MTFTIIEGDALKKLEDIEDESVDCFFTSPEPPYNYKEMEELTAIMLKIDTRKKDRLKKKETSNSTATSKY